MSGLRLYDLRNGYVDLLIWLTNHGRSRVSRGLSSVALTGVTLEFPDPTQVMLPLSVNRRINARLAAVEALQLAAGTFDADLLRRAAPSYVDVMVRPDDLMYGAYGPRLRRQLDQVYHELRDDPGSRRTVLSIWREEDLTHDGDRPCTLSTQFQVEDGRLELIVTMRSNDVWLGTPYDIFIWSQLQASYARQLGVAVGKYVHQVGNLHLYDRDREAADMLVKCRPDEPVPADYPRGVVAVHEADYPSEVARRLLDGTHSDEEAYANPWYVYQLARLGVTRRHLVRDVEEDA